MKTISSLPSVGLRHQLIYFLVTITTTCFNLLHSKAVKKLWKLRKTNYSPTPERKPIS